MGDATSTFSKKVAEMNEIDRKSRSAMKPRYFLPFKEKKYRSKVITERERETKLNKKSKGEGGRCGSTRNTTQQTNLKIILGILIVYNQSEIGMRPSAVARSFAFLENIIE